MSAVCVVLPALLAAMAFLVAERTASRLSRPGHPLAVPDRPNERSLHNVPKPRTGGLAIHAGVASAVIAWLVLAPVLPCADRDLPSPGATLWWILGCTVAAGVLSMLDDLRGLSPGIRFPVQLAIGAGVAVGGGLVLRAITVPGLGTLPLGPLAVPVTVLSLVWMANLYNFMDGMDGFSGGMTVIGFGFLAALMWRGGAAAPAIVALLVVGAAAGFLRHNFPPARIFMGDAGAVPLGFLAGALALWGIGSGSVDAWAPLLVFSPFIVDATVTLIRRVLRAEKVWQAHRSHYYQRLVLAGWGHRRTVLAEYMVMAVAGLGAMAFQAASAPARGWILAGAVTGYLALGLAVDRRVGRSAA